jgi:CheY-like chemotaxis protein
VSHSILKLHGAKLEVNYDNGNIIHISMPIKRRELEENNCTVKFGGEVAANEKSNKMQSIRQKKKAADEKKARRRSIDLSVEMSMPRFLVVEDTYMQRVETVEILEELFNDDIEVLDTVSNGQEGLMKCTSAMRKFCPYDVIFMDQKMSVMYGSEASKRMQGSGYKGYIVFVTDDGYLSTSNEVKGLEMRNVFFLMKSNRAGLKKDIKEVLIDIGEHFFSHNNSFVALLNICFDTSCFYS